MKADIQKLIDAYNKHGKIIVGVDFDDTIFPLSSDKLIGVRTKKVRYLLKQVKPYVRLCMWTVADEQTMIYKKAIAENLGLEFEFFNESPLIFDYKIKKPFFNILLDDNAGLDSAIETLTGFFNHISS